MKLTDAEIHELRVLIGHMSENEIEDRRAKHDVIFPLFLKLKEADNERGT